MKLLANGEEAKVDVPPALEPEEVEVAPARAAPEERDIPAKEAPPDGAKGHDRELPLNVGVFDPESQKFLDEGGTQAHLFELADDFVGRVHHAIEMHELDVDVHYAIALHGEVLLDDVGVDPVVPSGRDHLLEGESVVDGDGVGGAIDRSFELPLDDELEAAHRFVERNTSFIDPTSDLLEPTPQLTVLVVCDTLMRHDDTSFLRLWRNPGLPFHPAPCGN